MPSVRLLLECNSCNQHTRENMRNYVHIIFPAAKIDLKKIVLFSSVRQCNQLQPTLQAKIDLKNVTATYFQRFQKKTCDISKLQGLEVRQDKGGQGGNGKRGVGGGQGWSRGPENLGPGAKIWVLGRGAQKEDFRTSSGRIELRQLQHGPGLSASLTKVGFEKKNLEFLIYFMPQEKGLISDIYRIHVPPKVLGNPFPTPQNGESQSQACSANLRFNSDQF